MDEDQEDTTNAKADICCEGESIAQIQLRRLGDSDDWSGTDWLRVAFIVAYYCMTLATFAVHIWVSIRGWKADGLWWGVGYFGFFIYSELYWCYRSAIESGVSFFTIASGISGLWWVLLLLFKGRLSTWLTNESK